MKFLNTDFLFSVAKGAMMLRAVGKCAMMPVVDCRLRDETSVNKSRFSYPFRAMKIMAALRISILIDNSCTG
jgi:hypothetical protein